MKRGPSAEVVFGTTQPVKKAKIDDDNGKWHSGNHSKPGRMDKSGEAEEEERGQGGLETGCAFRFFHFRDPSQPGPCSLCIMSLTTTTTHAQTTNPRFMYSNHEIVKRSNAISIDASSYEFFC